LSLVANEGRGYITKWLVVWTLVALLPVQANAHRWPPLSLVAMIDGGAEHCQKAIPDLSSEIKAKYDQWNHDNAALLQKYGEDPEYNEARRMVISEQSSLPPSQQLEECKTLLKMMALETGKKLEEDLKPEEPLPKRSPESALDFRVSGHDHLSAGRTKEAIGDFTRAVELDPRDAAGYGGRGEAYLLNLV
jgi:hypothetical protein